MQESDAEHLEVFAHRPSLRTGDIKLLRPANVKRFLKGLFANGFRYELFGLFSDGKTSYWLEPNLKRMWHINAPADYTLITEFSPIWFEATKQDRGFDRASIQGWINTGGKRKGAGNRRLNHDSKRKLERQEKDGRRAAKWIRQQNRKYHHDDSQGIARSTFNPDAVALAASRKFGISEDLCLKLAKYPQNWKPARFGKLVRKFFKASLKTSRS